MARLVLGPHLRYVDRTAATVWLETDSACEVEVHGCRERTFAVAGHHYAILVITGLTPETETPYEVHLDGARVWPPLEGGRDMPPSLIRTPGAGSPSRIVFGSCRSIGSTDPSASEDRRTPTQHADALREYAVRMAGLPTTQWADHLVLLGDQVYSEHGAPKTRAFIRAHRDVSLPPGEACVTFAEFAHLYRETWDEPDVRWLLSTVPSVMIFDDHELFDDWNISAAWVADMRRTTWWPELVTSGLMAYWLYQHLGNLRPDELANDETLAALKATEDGETLLRERAARWDRGTPATEGARWSTRRDVERVRIVLVDSRNSRVLDPERRDLLDAAEWAWLENEVSADVDHLLVGTSLPFLMPPGVAALDAWNEAVTEGAWGRAAARVGERIRRGADAERWPAFQRSFQRLAVLLVAVARGVRGPAPASVLVLSGDIHQGYAARARIPGANSAVWQLVCSPFRFTVERRITWMFQAANSGLGRWAAARCARLAGVADPPFTWELDEGEWFANQIATLEVDGRRVWLRHEIVSDDRSDEPCLRTVCHRELSVPLQG